MSVRTAPMTCPYCADVHDAATGVGQDESATPSEGAVSICIRCGKASFFTKDLQLRKPTAEEAIDLATNETVIQAQLLIAGR
jgi:hypothetical protein